MCTYIYGPTERSYSDFEFGFEFVQYFKGVAAFAIQFIDKYYDRGASHAADFHQPACLGLNAFGDINDYYDRIDGCECAVCIFGKILVARGVENIDFVSIVFKAHDRCCDRNAALFLDVHPVGCRGFLDFIGFYGSGDVYCSTKEQ